MKKNECSVVRDLMPLVLDRVASEESREIVENHIGSCAECRKQYDAMKADLPEEARTEYEEEQKRFTDALKTVKKKRRLRRIRMIALAAAICLVVTLAGLYTYDALFNKYSVAVDNSLYSISVVETKNGRWIVTGNMGRINFDAMPEVSYTDGGSGEICYICLMTVPVHPANSAILVEEKREIVRFENDGQAEIIELRQGTPDNYLTVWKKGEPMPAASEELERYLEISDSYWEMYESLPETADGKIDLSGASLSGWEEMREEALRAVPEWAH